MHALPDTETEILEALERCRLLTSQQVRAVVRPERKQEWTRRRLNRLRARGLATFSERRSSHQRVWYPTKLGGEVLGSTREAMTEHRATGGLQAHDLAVNEVGICFMHHARVRGHTVSWRRELTHPVGSGRPGRGRALRVDAFLEYREPEQLRIRFIEVDRGSKMLTELLWQLVGYADLFHYRQGDSDEPLWRVLYPVATDAQGDPVFPRVLVLMDGLTRAQLELRLQSIAALCWADPTLAATPEVSISFALLEDLQRFGPYEPIWTRPGEVERVNWLGESAGLRVLAR